MKSAAASILCLILCLVTVTGAGAQFVSSDIQNHIRRLLRWQDRVDSPFLFTDRETVRKLVKADDLDSLRAALSERVESYADPKNPSYLGAVLWETNTPLSLLESDPQIIHYFCGVMLDTAFSGYIEHKQHTCNNGLFLIRRALNDLQTTPLIPDLLPKSSELLATVLLSCDLLVGSLEKKERGPLLEQFGREHAVLSEQFRQTNPMNLTVDQRMQTSACFGLITLFCSAAAADQDKSLYEKKDYREFTADMIQAVEWLLQSWNTSDSSDTSLEDLEYPMFYSLVFADAVRRVGGPNLPNYIPRDRITETIRRQKIPDQPLIIRLTEQGNPAPDDPRTWPPGTRNIFWEEGDAKEPGPSTPTPTPTSLLAPQPRTTPKSALQRGEYARWLWRLYHPKPEATPTPTPSGGWFPPGRSGRPSAIGPVLLSLANTGDPYSMEIWENGGMETASHPASLAWWREESPKKLTRSKGSAKILASNKQPLIILQSDESEDFFLARELTADGVAVGDYLSFKNIQRRIFQGVDMSAKGSGEVFSSKSFVADGQLVCAQKQNDLEWISFYRTDKSLGLPYFVSLVRGVSEATASHSILVPIESEEEIKGVTEVPRVIAITHPIRIDTGKKGQPTHMSAISQTAHLRIVFSSGDRVQADVIRDGQDRMLECMQPMLGNSAFHLVMTDTLDNAWFSFEQMKLEKGHGIRIPWGIKGHDVIVADSGEGVRGPTIETDGKLAVVSWDTDHNRVAYFLLEGTYLYATPSLRKGSLLELVYGAESPVTVSYLGRMMVFAEDCSIKGSYYASDLFSARQGETWLVPHKSNHRVTFSR
ncbi:MAG TPA: hypothetical protein PLQ35_12830 [bacterium]|nr:hypothetical protein [bacterium]HQL63170.1 hypothetical protein [bacterium]